MSQIVGMGSPRVVVITGASSGIGAALAKHLGAEGDSLVLGARREALLKQVAKATGTKAIIQIGSLFTYLDMSHTGFEKMRACRDLNPGHPD